MSKQCDLFLFAGEASGDLLGAHLIKALLAKNPSLSITAVAGPRMRELPITPFLSMEEFQVMGFTSLASHIPRLALLFSKVKQKILTDNPPIYLSIDYPGWSLKMARALRRASFSGKIVHTVCPSIWAWKKGRKQHMERDLDLLLNLFPFENKLFTESPLKTICIGHPLVKQMPFLEKKEVSHIALFPGSRREELSRNLPLQLKVAKELGLPFSIAAASTALVPLLGQLAPGEPLSLPHEREELLAKTGLAIAKLGTITLELALSGIPSLVTYGVSPIDRFLAEKVFRILLPHYCLPNILLGRQLFPEFIGPFFTEENLLAGAHHLLNSSSAYQECRAGCLEIREQLSQVEGEDEALSYLIKNFTADQETKREVYSSP